MSLQHRGEDDAVEDDVVLADEVHHLGLIVLPILLPIGRKILSSRDIANRSVEPYIQHLALFALDRHGDTPIQIAAYGTRLQARIEPRLTLAIDVGFPLLMALQNPLTQERIVLIQRKIPMFCWFLNGSGTRKLRRGVDQLVGRERRAALLALVAIRTLALAAGAGADDVAVGEEGLGLLVVVLLRGLLDELTLVVELAEEVRSRCAVGGR